MALVLKLCCDGDVRRKKLSLDSATSATESCTNVSLSSVDEAVNELFGLTSYVAMYENRDGEMTKLTHETLADALSGSLAKGVLRLEISCANAASASSEEDDTNDIQASDSSEWHHVEVEELKATCEEQRPIADADHCHGDEMEAERTVVPSSVEASDDEEQEEHSIALVIPDAVPTFEIHTPRPHIEADDQGSVIESEEEEQQDEKDVETQTESESDHQCPEEVATDQNEEITSDVKIQIVIAAFDSNGDGHLNFQESNDLQQFANVPCIPHATFAELCDECGEDQEVGLGAESLAHVYDRFGTLERDFAAAIRKLGGDAQANGVSESRRSSSVSCRALPLFGLSLAVPALSLLALFAPLGRRARA